RRRKPRLPDVPRAARRDRSRPPRAGRRPRHGPRPGRAGPRRPQVGRADGAVQPARRRGRLRLDGNPDVHRRAGNRALRPRRRRRPRARPTRRPRAAPGPHPTPRRRGRGAATTNHCPGEKQMQAMQQENDVVYAGFWRRWAALFLDQLILGTVFYAVLIVVLVAVAVATGTGASDSFDPDHPPAWVVTGYFIVFALYYVGAGLYYALMESSRHQATVGKMALGIKVTDGQGRRLSFGRALGRWFAAALSYMALY